MRAYTLGDMIARYEKKESGQVEFTLLPAALPYPDQIKKITNVDPMVQIKLVGDVYGGSYGLGNTMRNSQTALGLLFQKQEVRVQKEPNREQTIIETTLADDRGNEVVHRLYWSENCPYVTVDCTYSNLGKEVQTLEMFESFSLSNITPYIPEDAPESMVLHRMRSYWSAEGIHEVTPIEELGLETAWSRHAVRCERYGQVGSMPVNKFFPFLAVEDQVNHVFWGAQLAHNASWQMEVYRKGDALCISGGLADRDFGHWMKKVAPGESFTTPKAIVTVAATSSFDVFTRRLTEYGWDHFEDAPECERELPIIFNEYCTTWGNPSHENITKILDAIDGHGLSYFVIDCGWFKQPGIPWDRGMGDYNVSQELFPEGLEQTVAAIRAHNLLPGIWFEIENVANAAAAYQLEEHLLHRDGQVLSSETRRYWNMRDPWVQAYLTDKVIGTLKKYGFGYMKIDYNETIGVGCDGSESLGEGLRANMEASLQFLDKIKKEVPDIVLENCASGGSRLEPGLMARMSMASFSDAHELPEIPVIAANLHYVIHPAQSQIWCVIREQDSPKRIAWSVSSTFLGRMCLSGDVLNLDRQQWKVIDDGIAFYKKIIPIIKRGQTLHYGELSRSLRHSKGWQGIVRYLPQACAGDEPWAYVTIHAFSKGAKAVIPLPEGVREVELVYSEDVETDTKRIRVSGDALYYNVEEEYKSVAVLLR